jgi:hypothetical protein
MENFDLKKFLVENKMTTASKLTEGVEVKIPTKAAVELPQENREEILRSLKAKKPAALSDTIDHLLDTIAQEIQYAGYEVPDGDVRKLPQKMLAISGRYHAGLLTDDQAVDMLINLVMHAE